MKTKLFFCCCISLAFLFCFSNNNLGQEKINLSIGFGIYELANVGVRYQFQQTQIGFSVGTVPWSDVRGFSVLGDIYFHFGDISELSCRKQWYIRLGLTYLHSKETFENSYLIKNFFYLNSRIGREFNISKKIGLYVDLGVNLEISSNRIDNIPEPTEPTCCQGGPYENPILPAIGVGIYYRL